MTGKALSCSKNTEKGSSRAEISPVPFPPATPPTMRETPTMYVLHGMGQVCTGGLLFIKRGPPFRPVSKPAVLVGLEKLEGRGLPLLPLNRCTSGGSNSGTVTLPEGMGERDPLFPQLSHPLFVRSWQMRRWPASDLVTRTAEHSPDPQYSTPISKTRSFKPFKCTAPQSS